MAKEKWAHYRKSKDNQVTKLVAAGKTIKQLTDGLDRIWTFQGFNRHCIDFPAWGRKIRRISAVNAARHISAASKKMHAAVTHCRKRGHLLLGDNLGIHKWKADNGKVYDCRYCKTCNRLDARNPRFLTENEVQRVSSLIANNVPLRAVYSGGGDNYVTGHHNIQFHRTVDPAFDVLIRAHLNTSVERRIATRRANLLPLPGSAVLAAFDIASMDGSVFADILKCVPKRLPEDKRWDVAQDIVVALIEKRISIADIPRLMDRFVTANNIDSGSSRSHQSLNEPIWRDSNTSLIDRISSNEGLWGTELYQRARKWP